jgi:hypothetical protein
MTRLQDQLRIRHLATIQQPIETRATNFPQYNAWIKMRIPPNSSAGSAIQQPHNRFDTHLDTGQFNPSTIPVRLA